MQSQLVNKAVMICTCLGLQCLLLLSLAGTSSGSAQHTVVMTSMVGKLVGTTRDSVLTVYKSKHAEQENEQQRIAHIINMQANLAWYLLVLDWGQV